MLPAHLRVPGASWLRRLECLGGRNCTTPWGCSSRARGATLNEGRLLTCRAAHGDNAAAGRAEQGQQPLRELQGAKEVHLHAGTELGQWGELSVSDGVIEPSVVH